MCRVLGHKKPVLIFLRHPMRKYLLWPYQIYSWLIFVPYVAISTLFFGVLAVISVFLAGPKVASFIGGVIWSRLIVYATPIFVTVEGRNNVDKKQSYVIIANHQSHYDIPLLYGWLGVDFKWVMKKELRKIPGLGIGAEKVGHIFIDRSNTQKAVESIRIAKTKIKDGTSVVFFPEGTRSNNGQLKPFYKGAFNMARELQIPILPVTIVGTNNILPARSVLICPGKVTMVIHQPIPIAEYSDSDTRKLINKSKEIIASALN
jgi:1-acyl-sn-glycerol-3-phosphate acyltransferase